MSLINRMLQDLDKRQAGGSGESALPVGVQVATSAPLPPRLRPAVAVFALLGLALAATFHFWEGPLPLASLPFIDSPQSGLALQPVVSVKATPQAAPEGAGDRGLPAQSPVGSEPVKSELPLENGLAPAVTDKSLEKPVATAPGASGNVAAARPAAKKKAAREASEEVEPAHDKAPPLRLDKPVAGEDLRNVADFHYRQALDAYALGRTTESLAQGREAIRLNPDHLDARQLLLRQLVEQRDLEAARSLLRDGVARHPQQAGWVKLLLRLELERGDLTAARSVVEQAPASVVGQADFQSLAGLLAQRQGRQAEAADHFRSALGRNPADGRAWIGLGLALEAQGHEPEAREAFRRALTTEGLPGELQALAQKKTR